MLGFHRHITISINKRITEERKQEDSKWNIMPNEFILKNQQLQHLKFIRSFEPEVSAFSQFSYKKTTHILGGNILFLFNLKPWKLQTNVWNLFKVNNNDIRTTSHSTFKLLSCFHCNLGQVNNGWARRNVKNPFMRQLKLVMLTIT